MTRQTLAAAGIALLTVLTAAPAARAQQGRNDSVFNWSKQLPAGSRVTIEDGNGPIEVRESTTGRIEVRATKFVRGRGAITDVAFDVEERSGGVVICTVIGRQRDCDDRNSGGNQRVRVDFDVSMPRDMMLHANTGNGDVSVDRGGADVDVNTGNGRITIGTTTGRVDANTGNGDIHVESANGPVEANTGNGRVYVVTAQGGVSASTGNGDIDVQIKSQAPTSDMEFSSGSGSIRVTLPGNYNGRVDATSGNGTLQSDFEISIVGRLDAHHVRGTIGKGGPLLRLTTGSGRIELRKE